MSAQHTFFASCPKCLEGLLRQELLALGAIEAKETSTGVYFKATLEMAYRACLWSYLANHILLPLATIEITETKSLYDGVRQIDWSEHFTSDNTFCIDFSGQSSLIRNSQYGSQLVKDAIVDQFREKFNQRPSIETISPDIRIHAHLFGDKLTISIDLSGESLHRRGYRLETGAAPLKENLADAILIRSGWTEHWQEYAYFIDPLCGSGTFLIEAAWMAMDHAPGLLRKRFGFTHWLNHIPVIWKNLQAEAVERKEQGMLRKIPDIRGYDGSPRAISQARDNIARAGLSNKIEVLVRELSQLTPPTHFGNQKGLLVANPPYGERLGEVETVRPLYQHLGERLKQDFIGWDAAIFTGNPDLGKVMGIRAHKQYAFWNGTIECKLLLFSIAPQWFVNKDKPIKQIQEDNAEPLKAEAEMFANRLRKNVKSLQTWIKDNDIHCYRVYDADMPEYSVAIDVYQDWVHVQEYAPPKTIDPAKAQARLASVINAIPHVLNIPASHIIVKQRRQQKKHSQYEKFDSREQFIVVPEGKGKFLVNMTDYLDTGLFLDHRPMRLHLASIAQGKRFLNLYCYTATATVHAALGGAYRSVSVDMSGTYTNWARKNLALNGLSDALHRVIQMDCMKWLDENREKFDIIFLDPPTFSRSKRMQGIFGVQRDHVTLIRKAMQHLAPQGVMFFSSNFRKFVLDLEALKDFDIKDITAQTIDKDFARDSKVHQCFEVHSK